MVLQDMQLLNNKTKDIVPDYEEIPVNILSTGVQTKWKRGYSGKGIVVAVLDSGCQTNHPDLQERIIGGYNFTAENNGDITIYEDYSGHGTHVAGVIGGSVNKMGLVGVSPKVDLLILKVLNKRGAGSTESLVEAIHYAIDWRIE
jgi:major intracellular serine protease